MVSPKLVGDVMTQRDRCLVVGIGGRLVEDYLPAILRHQDLELVGGVDQSSATASRLPMGVPFFTSLLEAIENTSPTVAVVATPHRTHFAIVAELLRAGVSVLKEKPFALDLNEAIELAGLVRKEAGFLKVAVQRRTSRIFEAALSEIQTLGVLRHYTANYLLRTPPYGDTWRGSLADSGGGALIDMGYHTLDLLTWYFGVPERVSAVRVGGRSGDCNGDIEESVLAVLQYASGLTGKIFLSRCEPRKDESLRVVGTDGSMVATPKSVTRLNAGGEEAFSLSQSPAWPHGVGDVLDSFLTSRSDESVVEEELSRGSGVSATIDAAYRSMRSGGRPEPLTGVHADGLGETVLQQQPLRSVG